MMFDEPLPEDEQTQLASHLETCTVCQEEFEVLSDKADGLPCSPKELGRQTQRVPETTLQRLKEEIRDDGDGGRAGGEVLAADDFLEFLSPPRRSATHGAAGFLWNRGGHWTGRDGRGVQRL
jgi:hypothetical protein